MYEINKVFVKNRSFALVRQSTFGYTTQSKYSVYLIRNVSPLFVIRT